MFFIASKVYWTLASPILVLLMIALLGALVAFSRHSRFAKAATVLSLVVLIAAAATPLGLWLVRPLEDRFPPPPTDVPPPDGIIVLGGAMNGATSTARGQPVFDEGERVVEAVLLAKRYPNARIIFTGGSGSLFRVSTEAAEAKKLMVELGVDPSRITLEDKSRNTKENAEFTAAMIHPKPSERWLLVTSAFHMTRSMGVFEKAGFNVIAYPVAFRTRGPGRDLPWDFSPANNLRVFETATREWIGLAAYWATGRIDDLFPGPLEPEPAQATKKGSAESRYSKEGGPSRWTPRKRSGSTDLPFREMTSSPAREPAQGQTSCAAILAATSIGRQSFSMRAYALFRTANRSSMITLPSRHAFLSLSARPSIRPL